MTPAQHDHKQAERALLIRAGKIVLFLAFIPVALWCASLG